MLGSSSLKSKCRARIKHHELFTPEIKASFDPVEPLVLHWNGKIMYDFTDPGRQRNDLLPILASGQNVVKSLALRTVIKKVAMAATTAFSRHLWYLSEVSVGFGNFNDEVTVEEKRLMVKAPLKMTHSTFA